jgi:hypothetical protein
MTSLTQPKKEGNYFKPSSFCIARELPDGDLMVLSSPLITSFLFDFARDYVSILKEGWKRKDFFVNEFHFGDK